MIASEWETPCRTVTGICRPDGIRTGRAGLSVPVSGPLDARVGVDPSPGETRVGTASETSV
jgi:hypothetical protein